MEQKDTQYQSIENKGQSVSDSPYFAIQEKHKIMSFISKKTEKIATALYMVTDFIPESEPLRIQLRTTAVALMSKTRVLVTRAALPERSTLDEIQSLFDDAAAFTQLSETIGLVSPMNGSILLSEIAKCTAELSHLYTADRYADTLYPGPRAVVLTPSIFEVSVPKVSAPIHPVFVPEEAGEDKGQNSQTNVLYTKNDTQQEKRELVGKSTGIGIKIARRNDVLNIVKKGGQVSIKDITSILSDMSGKTIQRELLQLVKEGVLKKEGEKRWSTYKLVS